MPLQKEFSAAETETFFSKFQAPPYHYHTQKKAQETSYLLRIYNKEYYYCLSSGRVGSVMIPLGTISM